MTRHFDDWIDGFVEYTEGVKSPIVFRQWSAASAIAGALQRCNFTRISKQNLYPNMFVLLIANPGTGKSNAIKMARNIVRGVMAINLTPTRLTPRAFYNELEACRSDPIMDTAISPDAYTHSSLNAMIDELSVFVRPRASELMADLADTYDCPDPFEYKTATQGEILVENSFFNMIGGATPGYLKESWTKTVLDEGFPARCIIVFSEEKMKTRLFDDNPEDEVIQSEMSEKLKSDLKQIANLRGRFIWEQSAAEAFESWLEAGLPPAPKDLRLAHYNERRIVHIGKLCMILSASRSLDMEITKEDFERAQQLLLQAESQMIYAIESMGANPYRDAMVHARQFIVGFVKRNGKGCPENRVRQVLINEVDPGKTNSLLEEMTLAKWIRYEGEMPGRRFFPGIAGAEEEQ